MWRGPIGIITMILGGILALVIYILPTYLAFRRKHPNKIGVMLLNIFLGWTFVGYVGALIWALVGSEKSGIVPNGK